MLKIGNAYGFKLSEEVYSGFIISDIHEECNGKVNISISFVDFGLNSKPTLNDFIYSNFTEVISSISYNESDRVRSYSIWKDVFNNLTNIFFIGNIQLIDFETICSPISTINTETHIKNKFLRQYEEHRKLGSDRLKLTPVFKYCINDKL